MDKKNQIMIKEEMQRIVNSKDEEIDKATIEAIESMSERIPKEEIAGLEETMKSMAAKCMHDACVLAHLVYTEVVTGERTIYQLMESYPSFASYALMMLQLFETYGIAERNPKDLLS